ncbi:MAG: hypothetical protein ACE5OY_02025 [Candidatus Bathyarchaeia archaeon]
MKEIKVDLSSLGKDEVGKLNKFIAERMTKTFHTESESKVSSGKASFSFKDDIRRAHFRLLLRKFLHKFELKEKYRVISDGKAGFVFHKVKTK